MVVRNADFYVAEMILGLSFIHSQRVVHRDFLPENIMIAADTGHIRIVDFGSAK